jgi:hypothetical protein
MESLDSNPRAEEKQDREIQHATLESLEGFSRLSEKQKSYITATLYIQQRAERGTDPVSASRIQEMPKHFEGFAHGGSYIAHSDLSVREHPADKGKYFSSQLLIMSEYCHQAISKLESYGDEKSPSSEWREAGPIGSYAELEELIALSQSTDKLPFVAEIWDGTPYEKGTMRVHSTLLLGKNNEGEFMVWEKTGFHMPFQLIPLKQVYESYAKYTGWCMRSLSV